MQAQGGGGVGNQHKPKQRPTKLLRGPPVLASNLHQVAIAEQQTVSMGTVAGSITLLAGQSVPQDRAGILISPIRCHPSLDLITTSVRL